MKKINSIFSALLIVTITAVLSSCGIQGHVQKTPGISLSNYKTFAWLPHQEDSIKTKNFQDAYIRNSIAAALKKKGLTEVKENADVLVDYDVNVTREERTSSQAVYSQPYVGYFYNRYSGRMRRVYFPSRYVGNEYYQVPYKLGNITVNIVDNKTDEVAWQGWAETEVDHKRLSSDEMDGIVKAIFKKYKD
ncbi:MAG: DUF4136 domain-containing protein [Bacteroidetes bacterium]|nr:DUF4136 domain-containing protein [Bacteroidota bacterium]